MAVTSRFVGHQTSLPTLLSLSPPPPLPSTVAFPWCSQYLAAFTLNIVPLCWIPISSFSRAAAKNSILRALNHPSSEKVGELQILRSPTSKPWFLGEQGSSHFFFHGGFLFPLSISCGARGSLAIYFFSSVAIRLRLAPVIIRLQFGKKIAITGFKMVLLFSTLLISLLRKPENGNPVVIILSESDSIKLAVTVKGLSSAFLVMGWFG